MSGVHAQVFSHVVKRGVQAAQSAVTQVSPQYMAQLQKDAELYDNAGPDMEVQPWEMLPVMITGIVTLFLIASVKYTLGEVMASLAMIESPTSTAIIDDKPPAYADEPDAPLEKEPLMPSEAEADVEVTLIPNKPITSNIRTTVKHLHRIGGFRARWRGAGVSIAYHFLHSLVTNFLSAFLGFGLVGHSLVYVFASVALSRVHMAWTHAMVAYPSSKPFYRRMVPRKQCKAILLPSLVFALAQQATFILPMAVGFTLSPASFGPVPESGHGSMGHGCSHIARMALPILAALTTGVFVGLAVLLPATVTLTRIEALLLPEDQDTIVPFDRQAIVGDIDITARGASKALFVSAWRSFDRAARWRLIKLYVKMAMVQIAIVVVSAHLMVAELYVIGGERLAIFFKSATAQLKLAAIEAHGNNQPDVIIN